MNERQRLAIIALFVGAVLGQGCSMACRYVQKHVIWVGDSR